MTKFHCAYFLMIVFLLSSCSKSDMPPPEKPEEPLEFTGINPDLKNLSVRVLYIVPSDKQLNREYADSIEMCIKTLQSWYKQQSGKTFQLNDQIIESFQSKYKAAWFNQLKEGGNPDFVFFSNTLAEVKALLKSSYDTGKYNYLVYVDAQGDTGAGALGFCAMPENDLLGLTGQMEEPVSRWIGGAGHELGHTFGLPHPDEWSEEDIMSYGYTKYPNCKFNATAIQTLLDNKFINQ